MTQPIPRQPDAPEWRFRELIDALRPYDRIAARLEEKGYPRVPISSMWAWRSRNSIPPRWVLPMTQLGMEARVIGTIDDLLVKKSRKEKRGKSSK